MLQARSRKRMLQNYLNGVQGRCRSSKLAETTHQRCPHETGLTATTGQECCGSHNKCSVGDERCQKYPKYHLTSYIVIESRNPESRRPGKGVALRMLPHLPWYLALLRHLSRGAPIDRSKPGTQGTTHQILLRKLNRDRFSSANVREEG